MSDTTEKNGMRVLVVGSRRLDRPGYVSSVLNLFHRQFEIDTIITGSFSGSDAATRAWAKDKNMNLEVMEVPESQVCNMLLYNSGFT